MGPPEDFWLGAQHLVEGQGAPFFESPGKEKGSVQKEGLLLCSGSRARLSQAFPQSIFLEPLSPDQPLGAHR